MKKTLAILAVAAAALSGVSFADTTAPDITTTFMDIPNVTETTVNGLTLDKTAGTVTSTTAMTSSYADGNKTRYPLAVAISVDMGALNKALSEAAEGASITLVKVGSGIGITVKKDGTFHVSWGGNADNSYALHLNNTTGFADALSAATYTVNGRDFATMALVGSCADGTFFALAGGVTLDGLTPSLTETATFTANSVSDLRGGDSITSISYDKALVYSIAVNPSAPSSVADGTATPIANMVLAKALVPEPATATLSLLALAGLAARRRRK